MHDHRHRPATAIASLLAIVSGALAPPALASSVVIDGPQSSSFFGRRVTALPNGNIVIGSGGLEPTMTYLYDADGTLIRSMFGVGDRRPIPLGNDAFLLVNPGWNNNRGAVTRVDASTGLVELVSAANSIVGASPGDGVGAGGVVVLANGDYVICSPYVAIGGAAAAGAVTRVSATAPIYGAVSAANSLVGSVANDSVGNGCITELTNGNYVVMSTGWANGAAARAGAATWCSGTGACVGPVSAANSLVGSSVGDAVGAGVVALTNGNYVVRSPGWSLGALGRTGAATWGNGTTGTTGVVSAANSLVGSTANDGIDSWIFALRNGHYVVARPRWDNGAIVDAGAITWGDGNGGLVGAVTPANSLVGSSNADRLGEPADYAGTPAAQLPVLPLHDGNYVVNAMHWSDGAVPDVGAVLRANGNGGTVGTISPTNALVGTTADDRVGSGGVYVLANGHYVVASPEWQNGAVAGAGAVTWANGDGSTVGAVSASNSLIGSSNADRVGLIVATLSNGHYVSATSQWRNGAQFEYGAVTWGNGNGGTVGTVSPLNSIVGTHGGERVGYRIAALRDGNYVFESPGTDSNGLTDNGAVTWMSGNGPAFGSVPAARSLVGARSNDGVGGGGIQVFADGNFAVFSPNWDSDTSTNTGAMTLLAGNSPTNGTPQAWNSEFGTVQGRGNEYDVDYDPVNHRLIVGRSNGSRVTVVSQEQIFTGAFD